MQFDIRVLISYSIGITGSQMHPTTIAMMNAFCAGRIRCYFLSAAINIWFWVLYIQKVFHIVSQSIQMVWYSDLISFYFVSRPINSTSCVIAGLLIVIVGVLTTFTTLLVVRPLSFLSDIFEIEPYSDKHIIFRTTILVFPLIHLMLSYGIEVNRAKQYRYQNY